jgi:hypothetical protein
MIVWHKVTTKGASEALKSRKVAVSSIDPESGVCEGDIQLEIKRFEDFHQINKYTRYLSTIENLRIISESWSEDEGFNIVVSARVPLALARLLRDMPEVAQVEINGKKSGYRGNKKMVVMMKTADPSPEPALA